MAFVLKDGQGTLHRNDKGGVETRPDYRGELMLGGVLYEVAGWLKDGKAGKWMSLSVKPKPPHESAQPGSLDRPRAELDRDIPW